MIGGGESGKGWRPMQADWVRHVRDACVVQNVAFFMKQWGNWRGNPLARDETGRPRKCREVQGLDDHGTGGALLDGQLWREMPAMYWDRWAPLRKQRVHLKVVGDGEPKTNTGKKAGETLMKDKRKGEGNR